MKYFFALGAIASLCQSACALNSGTYTIASANTDAEVLTGQHPDVPLTFVEFDGNPGQIWTFNQAEGDYFDVRNNQGLYINCQQQGPRTCYPGETPQKFIPEFQGGTNYELVAQGSGLLLRLADDGTLQLAEYDQSINEQFSLKQT